MEDSNIDEHHITTSYIDSFIEEILSNCNCATNTLIQGDRLSAYYAPEFQKNIIRICKQFPLWSNVMIGYFQSPYRTATSASVEGNFSELKNKILKHDCRPMSADRFVVTHIKSLQNSMKFVRSEQLFSKGIDKVADPIDEAPNNQIIESYINNPTINLISDKNNTYSNNDIGCSHDSLSSSSSASSYDTLKEHETWKGLIEESIKPIKKESIKKRRNAKYTNACKDIDRILNSSRMRSHKKSLILNGNISAQCKIKKITYVLNNTCPFDALVVGIAVAYNDHHVYKQFIDDSKNNILTFSKDLALHGPTRNLYNKRPEILNLHFETKTICENVKSINAECNISKIIQCYLNEVPSVIENIICHQCGTIVRTLNAIILPLNEKNSNVQEFLNNYITETKQCQCGENRRIKRELGNHLFFETDIPPTNLKLNKIPKKLNNM